MLTLPRIVDVIGLRSQRDASGQDVKAEFKRFGPVPCSIQSVSGGETRRGQQIQSTTNRLVTMLFFPGCESIAPTDLLREMHGEKVHQEINVTSAIDPDGTRREWLVQGRSNG